MPSGAKSPTQPFAGAERDAEHLHTQGDATIAEDAPVKEGQRVGRYWLLQTLGRGGMGVVYLGYDPELHRKVAVKLLHDDATGSLASPKRLLREAQALAQLSHPNLVQVYDVGTFEGRVFVAMELVEGRSVAKWFKEEPPWRRVVEVLSQAGRGLIAAHAAGIVHRDFKPGNVVLGSGGVPRVLDFGLARVGADTEGSRSSSASIEANPLPNHLSPSQQLPAELAAELEEVDEPLTVGVVVGTPAYMAPEQHSGGVATAKSDQYSFCVTLYEGLYGQRPFPKVGLRKLARLKRVAKFRPAPAGVRVPGWLRRAVLKGLSPDPDDRHPSMESLLARLRVTSGATKARWTLAVGATAAAAASAWVVARRDGPSPVCDGVERAMDETYGEARELRIGAAFEGTGLTYATDTWRRLQPVVARYAEQWGAMRGEVCRATYVERSQSEALFDLRMACLERRRQELDAVLQLYESPSASFVQRAAQAIGGLTPLSTCADAEALTAAVPLPATEDDRAAVATAQGWLAEADALDAAGQHTVAERRARAAIAEGQRIGYRPLVAEAKLSLARTLDNDPAGAEAAAREAIELAAAVGADDTVREGLRQLMFDLGIRRGRLHEANGVAFAARMAWVAAGMDPDHDANLQSDLGLLAAARGDTQGARANFERSLAALESEDASMARRLVVVGGYAASLMQQGAWEQARTALTEARRLGVETYGARHPFVADSDLNLGQVAAQTGDAATANTHFEAALEVLEAAPEQNRERLALAYSAYAAVAIVEGRSVAARARARRAQGYLEAIAEAAPLLAAVHDVLGTAASLERLDVEAVAEHRKALQRATEGYGSASPNEAVSRAHLADSLAMNGEFAEARRQLDLAKPTLQAVFGKDSAHDAEYSVTEAMLALAEGDAEASRALAERALRRLPAGQRVMVARAHFVMAQALVAAGDLPGAARESGVATAALDALELAEAARRIEQWRTEHGLGE